MAPTVDFAQSARRPWRCRAGHRVGPRSGVVGGQERAVRALHTRSPTRGAEQRCARRGRRRSPSGRHTTLGPWTWSTPYDARCSRPRRPLPGRARHRCHRRGGRRRRVAALRVDPAQHPADRRHGVVGRGRRRRLAGRPDPVSMALPRLPVPVDGSPVASIRHDFGDTRHRSVSYRPRRPEPVPSSSRPTRTPTPRSVHSTPFDPIHVDSTERPPAPVVVSVAPAIRLDGEIRHEPRAGAAPRRARRSLVRHRRASSSGWSTPPAPGAVLERLDGRRGLVADVRVAARHHGLPGSAARHRRPPPGGLRQRRRSRRRAGGRDRPRTGTPICVVPFDLWTMRGRARFADLDLRPLADETDRPMVRLALVRFQRHSLRGPTASPVVRTDVVGLLRSLGPGEVEAAEPIFVGPGTTGDTLVVVQLGGDPVSREVEPGEWCAAAPADDALTATTDAGARPWTVPASASGPANPTPASTGLSFTRQTSGSTASSSPGVGRPPAVERRRPRRPRVRTSSRRRSSSQRSR